MLELHPMLKELELNLKTKFANVCARRPYPRMLERPRIVGMTQILGENASFPPAQYVTFDSE